MDQKTGFSKMEAINNIFGSDESTERLDVKRREAITNFFGWGGTAAKVTASVAVGAVGGAVAGVGIACGVGVAAYGVQSVIVKPSELLIGTALKANVLVWKVIGILAAPAIICTTLWAGRAVGLEIGNDTYQLLTDVFG